MLSIIIDEFTNHTKWHFFICSTIDLLTLHAPDWFSMSQTSEKGSSDPNYCLHPIKASRSTASSQLDMFFCFQTTYMLCSWLWWWDLPQHWTQPFSGHIRSRRREMSLSACPLLAEPFLGRGTRLWSQSRSGTLHVRLILPLYIKGLQICICW